MQIFNQNLKNLINKGDISKGSILSKIFSRHMHNEYIENYHSYSDKCQNGITVFSSF